jgi:hypothetical protein
MLGSLLAIGPGASAAAAPATAPASDGRATWTFDVLFATAVNADSRLVIRQAGDPDLDFTARWSSQPFATPWLWSLRVGREGERHAWALDFHHHKLFLENPPPEVQSFNISHGTNYVTAQHAWLRPRWRYFALAGLAFVHPENIVRGETWPETGGPIDSGHTITGPVVGGGVGAHVPIARWLHLTAEVRVTYAWLTTDVVGGDARTHNLALHLPIGVRLRY